MLIYPVHDEVFVSDESGDKNVVRLSRNGAQNIGVKISIDTQIGDVLHVGVCGKFSRVFHICGAHKKAFLRIRGISASVLSGELIFVIFRFHAGFFSEVGDNLLDLGLGGVCIIAVGDEPVRDVLGRGEEIREELFRGGGCYAGVFDLVIADFFRVVDFLVLPVIHQTFNEVVIFLVISGTELRGVRRVEVDKIGFYLRSGINDVAVESLVSLAVVENESVDAIEVVAVVIEKTLRGVVPLSALGRGREMPKTAAGHAGLAHREKRHAFFGAGQCVDVCAKHVQEGEDVVVKENAVERFLNECSGIGVVVFEQPLDVFLGEAGAVVLDDGAGGVIAVGQPVVGKDLQPLGFVHVADDGRARESVENRFRVFWRVAPYPVHKFLFGTDEVRDVFRALISGQFLGDKIDFALCCEKAETQVCVRFEEKIDFLYVGFEFDFHLLTSREIKKPGNMRSLACYRA
ncbi:MAG: hypothetical protein BWY28_01889 [bacterium ADurb.Bin236]|nr:MAG: hypothetical protein BWY28_01889 [bacterium ADurb.Bin236]